MLITAVYKISRDDLIVPSQEGTKKGENKLALLLFLLKSVTRSHLQMQPKFARCRSHWLHHLR